jgi:hypothetical protein
MQAYGRFMRFLLVNLERGAAPASRPLASIPRNRLGASVIQIRSDAQPPHGPSVPAT